MTLLQHGIPVRWRETLLKRTGFGARTVEDSRGKPTTCAFWRLNFGTVTFVDTWRAMNDPST